jgi:HEAT repeat protein
MGLDYSYNILCDTEKAWDVLQDAAEWGSWSFSREKVHLHSDEALTWDDIDNYLESPQTAKPLYIDAAFLFPWDEALRDYYNEDPEWRADLLEHHPTFFEKDVVGVGSITVSLCRGDCFMEDKSDAERQAAARRTRIQFRAVTTRMSLLFEQSSSIRQRFCELAARHEPAICVLDREGPDVVLWFDGREIYEELPSASYMAPSDIARGLRENAIARTLREETTRVLDHEVFEEAMKSEDAEIRAVAVSELGAKSYRSRKTLCQALMHDSDVIVRRRAAEVFGRFGYSWGLAALNIALDDRDDEVRKHACRSLSSYRVNDHATMQKLYKLMQDENKSVRYAAAEAFAKNAHAEYSPQLTKALSIAEARGEAAKALGRLREWKAVDELCEALKMEMQIKYSSSRTVIAITEALVLIGDRRAVPHLIRCLTDLLGTRDCHSRNKIAKALGDFAAVDALPVLRETVEKHQCCAKHFIPPIIERIEAIDKLNQSEASHRHSISNIPRSS